MFRAVSQLLRSGKDREEWFSLTENYGKTCRFGLHQLRNCSSALRVFNPPEFPVLSLEVQAHMPVVEALEQTQFRLLVRHFLERFFNNEMVSSDGDAKKRLFQAMYAIALPLIVVALFLAPPYHAPLPRSFWSQASDHYFYLLYSFVTMGLVSIFSWDLLFPDLLDMFILTPLPIASMRLFLARIVAACLYLGLFLCGTSALGAIFFPLLAEPPQFTRHVFAHLLAVLASGAFAAGATLSLQGLILAVIGERLFRAIAPFLQALMVTMLLSILFLFPVTAQFLHVLTSLPVARYFPPFWFLGIYETLLSGPSSLPVFPKLAETGGAALAVVLVLVVISYPLAYRRRMRYLVEESGTVDTRTFAAALIDPLLHATLLRKPVQRGIHHFISYSLLRTRRHRVYLVMYGGLGLALLIASAVLLRLRPGHVGFQLSADGLRAAVPIVAFWTITGLRTAFVSPTDKRGSWLFRVILGRPGVGQLDATELWMLPFAIVLTLGVVALVGLIAPPALHGWRPLLSQALVGVGLSLLLTDVLFLAVRSIPFTGGERASGTNLAFILLQYFGLFPPLVLLMVDLQPWLEVSLWHSAVAIAIIATAHNAMRRTHKKNAEYHENLIDLDEDEEEFPQRLGLRY
jgi:hypothetical protein